MAERMSDHYSTDKILHHPDAVRAIQRGLGHTLPPIFVQLMPQNVCNHACSFCSYRLPDWKNSKLFDESKAIPWPKMLELLADFVELGVKAVEVTGGGEPLAYPHITKLFDELGSARIETSLVTNGTLLKKDTLKAFSDTDWKWVRVSIDAGDAATYAKVRKVSESHFSRAWSAVRAFAGIRTKPDQRVGVGFVVTDENWQEVYACCERAKESGADNIRVSVGFTDKEAAILTDEQAYSVAKEVERAAADLNDGTFQVVDLFKERIRNLTLSTTQDYDYCGTKDVLCVIEGEGNVYTCCTLAGDPRGLVGNVSEKRFVDLWWESANWRRTFNVRKRCQCVCLYEKRNRGFLKLRTPPPHVNFV